MLRKVLAYCEQQKLFTKQDTVIVGISGGADSVCLLSILKELAPRYDLRIEAVHVNHLLRGDAAEADADFTKRFCGALGVPCTVYEYPVAELAKERALSLEEAGRRARYALLLQHAARCRREDAAKQDKQRNAVQGRTGTVKIAVAHHMDDQAETVLLHLLRGSGLNGLSGMQPKRLLGADPLYAEILRLMPRTVSENGPTAESDAAVHDLTSRALTVAIDSNPVWHELPATELIRPLLCVTREEIEAYLAAKELSFCEDASNAEDAYTRNKIRNHVLSYIKEEIAPTAVGSVCRSASVVAQAQEFLAETADQCLRECAVFAQTEIKLKTGCFLRQHAAIQSEMVRQCVGRLGALKDVTQHHIDSVCALARGQTGRELALPGGVYAYRDYGTLVLSKMPRKNKRDTDAFRMRLPDIAVEIPGVYFIKETNEIFTFTKKTYRKGEIFPNSAYTKWFDYDKISCRLKLRGRQAGDYLQVNAAGGAKKLKNYLIDCKCPANMRDRLLLLADGSHILWVPGYRISEAYKITEQTKHVLIVTRTQGEDT